MTIPAPIAADPAGKPVAGFSRVPWRGGVALVAPTLIGNPGYLGKGPVVHGTLLHGFGVNGDDVWGHVDVGTSEVTAAGTPRRVLSSAWFYWGTRAKLTAAQELSDVSAERRRLRIDEAADLGYRVVLDAYLPAVEGVNTVTTFQDFQAELIGVRVAALQDLVAAPASGAGAGAGAGGVELACVYARGVNGVADQYQAPATIAGVSYACAFDGALVSLNVDDDRWMVLPSPVACALAELTGDVLAEPLAGLSAAVVAEQGALLLSTAAELWRTGVGGAESVAEVVRVALAAVT